MNSSAMARDPGTYPVADCLGRVLSNDAMGIDYRRLVLAASGPATGAQAGQFFQILCPSLGSTPAYLRRPMSMYRAHAASGRVEFLYKVTGAGTRGLAALRRGAKVSILGPLGRGFRLDPGWNHIVVVGRGVGLATLAPLADLATAQRISVTAILSGRSDAHVISRRRFVAAGGQVVTVVDSDNSSDPQNVERIIRKLVADGRADAFFTCGSNRLLLLLQRLARAHGIPGQVAIEQQMACGLGMCFSCVRPFSVGGRVVSRRVCWEGPVFDLQETLEW